VLLIIRKLLLHKVVENIDQRLCLKTDKRGQKTSATEIGAMYIQGSSGSSYELWFWELFRQRTVAASSETSSVDVR